MFIWRLCSPATLVFPGAGVGGWVCVWRTVYRDTIVSKTMWSSKFDNYLLVGSKSVVSLLRVKFLLTNLRQGLKDPSCLV